MERSPKSHREEQSAVAESKRKLANSKLRLMWERSIGGAYQKRERGRLREEDHGATTGEGKEDEGDGTAMGAALFGRVPRLFHISRP
jgi:hypothetical protein